MERHNPRMALATGVLPAMVIFALPLIAAAPGATGWLATRTSITSS